MSARSARFLVDTEGNQVGVVLDMVEYRRLLKDLEELEAIRAYDEAKRSGDEVIPVEQALREIEAEQS